MKSRVWKCRRLTLGLATGLLACNPRPTTSNPPSPPPQKHASPSEKQSAADERAREEPFAKENCGLPKEIQKDDWPRQLAPTSPQEPKPWESGSTTIAVLPDTQYYVSCREAHFENQARYLKSHRRARNVLAAIHLGDLTEHNTPAEWEFVQHALSPLFDAFPLLLATGNHDYGDAGSANERQTLFQKYFSTPATPTKSVTADLMKPGDWENAYYRLPLGSARLGVLILEWSPRTQTVAWAKKTIGKYPQDRIIFVTHAYLYYDGNRYDWSEYGPEQEWNPRAYGTAMKDPKGEPENGNWAEAGAFDGEMLWQELLIDHPGVFLTLNGHVLGDGAAVRSDQGNHGNTVHQVLVNYQMLDEGGLGYLRLIEIDEPGKRLTMKTYSPSLRLFATAEDQSFSLPIEPPLY